MFAFLSTNPLNSYFKDAPSTPEIVVVWGREKLYLDFENEGPGSLQETTLKQLKERIKKMTGVPVNGQKLLVSGAIMKDDTATLSSFGLHPSSKIMLMGTKPNSKDLSQTTAGSAEEHALLSRISQSIENTRSLLLPQIQSFELSVDSYLSSGNQDEKLLAKLTDTHHYLVETLMQAVLALDGVVCPPEFETARKKRREAVKFTQELIDRVDAVRETLNVTAKGV